MTSELGWHWPENEVHMQAWLKTQKKPLILNDRQAYQGKKQLAALSYTRRFRTAIDVGAHVGLWSYNLAHAFEHVHAFEPVAEFRACFELNVTRPNVKLYPYALGEETEFVSITIPPDNTGATHISGKGDIEVCTLDSFYFTEIDLLKIDCEGYELKVLRGARETLLRCKPVVIVEQKRDMASSRYGLPQLGAVDYLQKLGARLQVDLGGDFILTFDE